MTAKPNRQPAVVRTIERYQWMAHKKGGQTYGNQEEIRPLGKEDFDRHLSNRVMPERFEPYVKQYPDTFVSLVRQNNRGDWRLNRVGSFDELRPSAEAIDRGWVKKVDDFSSREAVQQARTIDG